MFKIGDKVYFVANKKDCHEGCNVPPNDKILIIGTTGECSITGEKLYIIKGYEFDLLSRMQGFRGWTLKKVEEDFAESVLESILEQIKEEELVEN